MQHHAPRQSPVAPALLFLLAKLVLGDSGTSIMDGEQCLMVVID